MTLFINTPRRVLEISDAYLMALTLLIFFAAGRVFRSAVEKVEKQEDNEISLASPRGGNFELPFYDNTEVAQLILVCIADNNRYIVKDPRIIKVVFDLVKAKIRNESLILSPNVLRFVALKLVNNDQSLIVKIGNIVASSNNRMRLLARLSGSATIGFLTAIAGTFPYAVLLLVLWFNDTENCDYTCDNYFDKLPQEGPAHIYVKESTGNLLIGKNEKSQQIEMYIPSKTAADVTVSRNGDLKTTKTYTQVRKKAKEVKFSDFKKTDPVLSSFKDLKEPEVQQRICPFKDIYDDIDILAE